MQDTGALKHLPEFISKIKQEGLPPIVGNIFSHYYEKVLSGETGLVHDCDIEPIPPETVESAENLEKYRAAGKQAFHQSAMITLNGGLGTSMGLTGPKSLLEVKNGKSFLDIIVAQTRQRGTALALMNSFSTHAETLSALSKIDPAFEPLIFLQHKFPKILRDDYAPATWPQNPQLEWNPPGHGDVYTALYTSGMLQTLLDRGIIYAFIANSDNLGARLNPALLGYFATNRFPFMMEVARKTPADVKGGHLARHKSGRLLLREAAQCSKEDMQTFYDIQRFCFFNTNNVWVNLVSLKELIDREKAVFLPMILNPKSLDPRDSTSPGVYQVETAMGAAISLFDGATVVQVPRSRFFPVKKCDDLLAVRSDLFILSDTGDMILNPQRRERNKPDTIRIKLDPEYYGRIDLFDDRFNSGVPSLIDCETLTIEGDVNFEANVTISGRVVIQNRRKTPVVIEESAFIDQDRIF
jgi:UTP--glucose-1-phosphate uridylyltransferase